MTQPITEYSDAAIFSRMIEEDQNDLSPELAQHILYLTVRLLTNSVYGNFSTEEEFEA